MTARPVASTVWLDSTQLPGLPVLTVSLNGEPGPLSLIEIPSSFSLLERDGLLGRRHQVRADPERHRDLHEGDRGEGDRHRRQRPPEHRTRGSTPSTTANTAYPTGTMPRIANDTGVSRDGRLPWVLLSAPSSGCDHQVTARVSSPTAAAATRASSRRASWRASGCG